MADHRPKRPGTVLGDRGEYRRAASHPAIPETITDEPGTGVVEGEALKKIRRRRNTTARVEHVEDRLDGIEKSLTEWRVEAANSAGDIKGAIGELGGTVKGLEKVVTDLAERKQVTYVAGVNIQEAQAVAATEVGKTKAVEAIQIRGHKWKLWIVAAGAGATVLELVKLLLGWLS